MMLGADFNTVSDWVGIPLLVIALTLLIVGEVRPSPRVPTWLQGVAVVLAVGFIGVRFLVMI